MRVEVTAHTSEAARFSLGDLRVQGQTRTLADYIRSSLRFPAPDLFQCASVWTAAVSRDIRLSPARRG